jgi:hypothetical protein
MSHPPTFHILNDIYAMDHNYAYYYFGKYLIRLNNIDPVTFKALGQGYAKDKEKVYYGLNPIEFANAKRFKAIDPKTNKFSFDAEDDQSYFKKGAATLKGLEK